MLLSVPLRPLALRKFVEGEAPWEAVNAYRGLAKHAFCSM